MPSPERGHLRRVRARLHRHRGRRRAASSCTGPASWATPGSRSASRPRRRWPAWTGARLALDEALDEAAAILRGARAPLVCGLGADDIEAQREAVALADAIGATIDPGASRARVPGARREHGDARRDPRPRRLVVVWRADPEDHAPAAARACGAAARALVVVDASATATAEPASVFIVLRGARVEALWTLRALVRGVPRRDGLRARAARRAPARLAAHGDPASTRPRPRWRRSRCTRSCATSRRSRTGHAAAARATSTPPAPRTCWPGRRATPARSASPPGIRARAERACSSAATSTRRSSWRRPLERRRRRRR